jgi:hypothetical protein
VAPSSSMMGVVMGYWNISQVVCIIILLHIKVAYNKYYLEHMTTINHKPTFIMVRRDPMPDTIENKIKEDTMETW